MHCGMSNVDGLLIHLDLSALTSSRKSRQLVLTSLSKTRVVKCWGVVSDAITPQVIDLKDVLLLLCEKCVNVLVAVGEG